MLVKAQAAATAARRLKRKVEEEEEELANLAVKIIERADQVEVLDMEPCLNSLLCRRGANWTNSARKICWMRRWWNK